MKGIVLSSLILTLLRLSLSTASTCSFGTAASHVCTSIPDTSNLTFTANLDIANEMTFSASLVIPTAHYPSLLQFIGDYCNFAVLLRRDGTVSELNDAKVPTEGFISAIPFKKKSGLTEECELSFSMTNQIHREFGSFTYQLVKLERLVLISWN